MVIRINSRLDKDLTQLVRNRNKMCYSQILVSIQEESATNKPVSVTNNCTINSNSRKKILIARYGFKMDRRMFRLSICII